MNDTVEQLALLYADKKLTEYLLDKREAPMCGSTDMSEDEVKYLKSAYDFAIKNLGD